MAAETTDVCPQARESIFEDHIFEAINSIRYEKKRRPNRESVLRLIQIDVEVTTVEFNKLLDTIGSLLDTSYWTLLNQHEIFHFWVL